MAGTESVAGRVRWKSGVMATLGNDRKWTIEGDGPEASAARVWAAEIAYPGPAYGFPNAWLCEELARLVPGGEAEYEIPEPVGGRGTTVAY